MEVTGADNDMPLGLDPQVAYDKLASLDTAEEIAAFFKEQGVIAWPGRAESCAISQWMKDVTGIEDVKTGGTSMHVGQATTGLHFQHTKAMAEFIMHFDSGDYEDLIPPRIHIPDPSRDRCIKCHISGQALVIQRREALQKHGPIPMDHEAFATCPGSGGRTHKLNQAQATAMYETWLAEPHKWGQIGEW